MWWKILLIILAVALFGPAALKVISSVLHTVANALRWLADLFGIFGLKGVLK